MPTPQPVPNSASVPVRVAASVASSRPVSLRQNDTFPARRDTSNARDTISGTSGGALMGRSLSSGAAASRIVKARPKWWARPRAAAYRGVTMRSVFVLIDCRGEA